MNNSILEVQQFLTDTVSFKLPSKIYSHNELSQKSSLVFWIVYILPQQCVPPFLIN